MVSTQNKLHFGVRIPKTYITTSTPYTDRLLANISCLDLFPLLRIFAVDPHYVELIALILLSRSLTGS
jgi:hypothetical protein